MIRGWTDRRPLPGAAVRGVRTVFSSDEEGFNDQLFASLTLQVITDGMDNRRSMVREAILVSRRNTGIEEYTVAAAEARYSSASI